MAPGDSLLLFCAFVFLCFPLLTFQCATNGLCGGYGYCSQPPLPPPPCSCRPAYSCGSYGCFRARARSSKTLQVVRNRGGGSVLEKDRQLLRDRLAGDRVKDEPLSPEDLALASLSESAASLKRSVSSSSAKQPIDVNAAFYSCCLDRNLPDACLQKCHFGSYNREQLTRMYFKQDGCPIEAMAELQFCAAQGRDHRECCARNGVSTTLAGLKCLTFCDQTPGRVTPLDLSYMPCLDRFENMKACFYHEITRYYTLR